jgi:hypothetical protein
VNIRKIVILFVDGYGKKGGQREEYVIVTWGNGELRIIKAMDALLEKKGNR